MLTLNATSLPCRREMALISAHAAWHMGAWDDMRKYVSEVECWDTGFR